MSQLSIIIELIKRDEITVVHVRDIDFTTIEDQELKKLADLIREKADLSSISLHNVNLAKVKDENFRPILEAIQHNKKILQVSLVDNNLGASPEKFLLIMEFLIGSNVAALDLSANNLGLLANDTLKKLLNFKPNLALKEINLSDNQLGSLGQDGLSTLGQYLVLCKGIIDLQIYDNSLGSCSYTTEFIERLQQLPLEELNLAKNELGELANPDKEIDMGIVIKSLTRHPTLQRLNLADNALCEWGDRHLINFLDSVLQNNLLKKIDITANQFVALQTSEEWEEFLSSFKKFVKKAASKGVKIMFNYLNFDPVMCVELSGIEQEIVSEQKMQPMVAPHASFFTDANCPEVNIEKIGLSVFAILQKEPKLIKFLWQHKELIALVFDRVSSRIMQSSTVEESSFTTNSGRKIGAEALNGGDV